MLKRPGRRHAVLALIACLCTPFAAAAAGAGDSLVAGLPASFAGVLPYPGCAEARTQLDLWPDGVFHRQRICLDQPGRDDDRGRWRRAANEQRILLHRGREMPLGFAWRDAAHLLPLDLHRQPPADAATGLRRLPAFAPAPLQLALHGMFSYLADAPGFSECLTGRAYPVAMEGDYLALGLHGISRKGARRAADGQLRRRDHRSSGGRRRSRHGPAQRRPAPAMPASGKSSATPAGGRSMPRCSNCSTNMSAASRSSRRSTCDDAITKPVQGVKRCE